MSFTSSTDAGSLATALHVRSIGYAIRVGVQATTELTEPKKNRLIFKAAEVSFSKML